MGVTRVGGLQILDGGVGTSDLANNAVTYLKFQTVTLNKLLGSGATDNNLKEITLGTGLSFTGSTLNASVGTILNGTGFVKASGTTITYDNSTYSLSTHVHTSHARLGDYRATMTPANVPASSFAMVFSTQGAMLNQVNDTDYSDVLLLNSYSDGSGGLVNALSFDKSIHRINHFIGTYGAATWTSSKTLAYTSDIIWNANTQATAGYVAAGGTNYNMVWATDGSGNPGWGSVPATAGATATHAQPVAATTWTFNHNLGQLYPVFTVYNASNQVVIPATITAVTINQSVITFYSALAGNAVAVLGGTGATGANGLTPTLSVGTVTTGAAGTSVIITEGGTALAKTFNFTIPRGDTGAAGIQLTNLSSTMTGLTYTNTTGVFSATAGYAIPTTTKQTQWDTAYTQTLQWNGGATNLVAATGRASLGLVIGTNIQAYNASTTIQGVITLASLGYVAYVHPSGDGELHVPATSTTNNGKVLTAGATAGSFSWQTPASGVTDHTLLSNIGTNTHAQIDTALTRLANTSGTNTGDNAINSLYSGLVSNATHTGEVTGSAALTITAGAVTLAKMADMATASLIYRKTAGTGVPEINSLATLKTDLGLTGTNSGDQTSGTVSIDDHSATPSTAKMVGIVYGTSATPPTANTTPIGTLYIQYTA